MSAVSTKRTSLGQVLVCLGCCCGRVDRGKPPVPVERLKSVWASEKLNRTIQLTISGCLGPCDVCNVAAVIARDRHDWFGRFSNDADYERLIAWARACHEAGELLPLPPELDAHRFERFPEASTVA